MGELLNIGHKRGGDRLTNHRSIVTLIEQATLVVDTDRSSMLTASQIAERHKLQYFDALICTVAQSAGATALVTEDMHNGLRLGSLTIINPFLPDNRERIEELLAA